MALKIEIPDSALSAQLTAMAEQQIATSAGTDRQEKECQGHDDDEATSFLKLFDALDVDHRLPLLDSNTRLRYRAMFQTRWILLSEWLEAAAELPALYSDTAQHAGAKRTSKMLLGSTLHHSFDSACKAVSCLIDGSPMRVEAREKAAMTAFMKVCAKRLSPATDRLHMQLAGAIVTGLLTDFTGLLENPGHSRSERRITRKKLRAGLSDLLDILDVLSLQSTKHVIQYSEDYLDNGRTWRARRLLETSNKANGQCMDTRLALSRLYTRLGRSLQAIEHLQAVVLVRPDELQLRTELASLLLERLEFSDAIDHLRHSLTLTNADESLQLERELELAEALNESEEEAALAGTVPTIVLSDAERKNGRFDPVKLALAARLYKRYGTLVVHNVFSTELIRNCHDEFLHRYRSYFSNREHPDALQIGDRRLQISLALAGAFNDPEFYANRFLLPLMKKLLGDQLIIGSTVCVTSLPGSRDQQGHKDHRALFTDTPDDDPMLLPPVAVTTMIPLVSINEENGTTLVKKGSHRLSRSASSQLDYQVPIVPVGSCYLMDLALTHKGQGNKTDQLRPIVNMVYHRSWFMDNKNFRKQPPLQIDSVEYRQIPVENRHLFDWAIQPGAHVNTPR